MSQPSQEEINANLERAELSLQAAQELLSNKFVDFAASRAYYAAFYAATAALLSEGLDTSKHSGVIALIHQKFVKTGKIDKALGRDLNWLFGMRNIGDYGVMFHVDEPDAHQALRSAENFVRAIQILLQDK